MTDQLPNPPVDDGEIIHAPSPESSPVENETSAAKPIDEDAIVTETAGEADDEATVSSDPAVVADQEQNVLASNELQFDEEVIDLRGVDPEKLSKLIRADENELGPAALDAKTRTVGSWENTIFRAILEPNFEEKRLQEAMGKLTSEDRQSLASRYRNTDNKTVLRSASLIIQNSVAGEIKSVSGEAALMAFECQEGGGGFRIPLFNSGITIDVMTPTGNDLQTLLTNCLIVDEQLGTSDGAHYFAFNDVVLKNQVLDFLRPLIINSSYNDWRKSGRLWSVIKFPDLVHIVASLAALCYKDGFEGFRNICTRPLTEQHPTLCRHIETLTINIFELIITRYAVLSKESIDFMVAARLGNAKNNIGEIAKYQSDLGLEGERLVFGNVTFTMRIPTLAEHLDAGSKFMADVINEIEGDNTEGRYNAIGLRYIRSFVPWIASVERKNNSGGGYTTSDTAVIIRQLEKLDGPDDEGVVRDKLTDYINRTQLTYVGYPNTACANCGYVADTPSGMQTFDPFTAFFTLAYLSSKPDASKTPKG